ncbi:hypothetical protein H1V43_27120 [Streptomyces sp. PSKA54]|uniref:Transmembrane protein n=2 Tax=Streptomyces TaxID=1883 RepID=A0A7W2D549_9ACTN|nr:hypothetical protein [Streptomyces himalayensis subsp. aureolus]
MAAWEPRLSDAEANAEAKRIINEAYRPVRQIPTAYRDFNPTPLIGDAEPIRQDDRRTVPAWAAGTAVASIGIGAGVTGIGCGAWLVLKGLSAMTITGVAAICAPFIGVAFAALAIGAAVSKAKASSSKHIYQGSVTKHTHVTTHTRGVLSRTHNHLHS